MTEEPLRVLLVEDNPGDANLVRLGLREVGSAKFDLTVVETLKEGLDLVAKTAFHVVLLDLTLPDATDLKALDKFLEVRRDLPYVVLTHTTDSDVPRRALEAGAQDFLVKGRFDSDALARAMRYAVDRKRGQQAQREQVVTKAIVRRILGHFAREGVGRSSTRRELGRLLAREAREDELRSYLLAFRAMGLGDLHLEGIEGARYTFTATNTIDSETTATMATCDITLGFVEGAVSAVTSHETLGTEVGCESLGHPRCKFVVIARETRPSPAP